MQPAAKDIQLDLVIRVQPDQIWLFPQQHSTQEPIDQSLVNKKKRKQEMVSKNTKTCK
ncbi:MAG: hypothetical protein AAGE93_05500 [Bacteroidota bacterium]